MVIVKYHKYHIAFKFSVDDTSLVTSKDNEQSVGLLVIIISLISEAIHN